MQTYIEIILLGYIFSLIFTREFLLCAHGWAERTQLYYWRHISQSEIRNSAAAEKRGRAKIPSPQPPSFLPARAIGFQNSASGFSSKKVRILTKRHRQFSEFGFWAIVASPSLRSGSAETRILKGFLKSQNNFCPLKRKFGLPKANINLKIYQPIFFLSPLAKGKAII